MVPARNANGYGHIKRSIYDKILKDDGHFPAINPLEIINRSYKAAQG